MRIFWITLFILLTHLGWGQDRRSFGLLPEVTLTRAFSENWSVIGSVETMQRIGQGDDWSDFESEYNWLRTDITGVVSMQINPLWKVAAGYMNRIQAEALSHRTLQQVAYLQRLPVGRLGHRLRTDQTFRDSEKMELRVRYRLSGEWPLNGQSINPGEWYIIGSLETVWSLQGGASGWEQRGVSSLGYYINKVHKIELGIDVRMDEWGAHRGRHRLWGTINYFVNI
jgi:hypothetical protein